MKKRSISPKDQFLYQKIFLAVVFLLIIYAAIGIGYYRFYVIRDYDIIGQVDCDPKTEKCFVSGCDLVLNEGCAENPTKETSYYKLIRTKANLLAYCTPGKDGCPMLACSPGQDCEEILCDADNVSEDESCNDPDKYIEDNTSEEVD